MSYMKLTEELARRHLGYDGRYYVGPDITDLEPMVEGAINEVLKRMIYELGRAKLSQATEPVTDLHYFSTAVSKYKVYATVEGRVHSYTETGYGYIDGHGSGAGYGDIYGNGEGDGSGSGSGDGYGYIDGDGFGYGSGVGSGDGSSSGSCGGDSSG